MEGDPPAASRLLLVETNLRGFRGLTLDAFGSLLEGGTSRTLELVERAAREHGLRDAPAGDLWTNLLRGHLRAEPFIPYREAHRRAFRELFQGLGISADPESYVDRAFEGYRRAKAYPEARSVLEDLAQNIPLAVISDMDTALLLEVLQDNDLLFTYVITAEEEQAYKPSPGPFLRAARYVGLPPAHILHVGDSETDDVGGASSVGMGTALIRRSEEATATKGADSVVRSLTEVRALVRRSWQGR